MTLYFRFKSFSASPNLKSTQGENYVLKLLVEGLEKKSYQIKGENIKNFNLSNNQAFMSLSAIENNIAVRLFKQDFFQNLKEVFSFNLTKKQIIVQNGLDKKKNLEEVQCQLQLQNLLDSRSQGTSGDSRYKIVLEVKLDKYKKILTRIEKNTQFLNQLGSLLKEPSDRSGVRKEKKQQFYLGPCVSKNVFSCCDQAVNKQNYNMLQPYYP